MPWKRGVYTAEPTHHLHITSTPPGCKGGVWWIVKELGKMKSCCLLMIWPQFCSRARWRSSFDSWARALAKLAVTNEFLSFALARRITMRCKYMGEWYSRRGHFVLALDPCLIYEINGGRQRNQPNFVPVNELMSVFEQIWETRKHIHDLKKYPQCRLHEKKSNFEALHDVMQGLKLTLIPRSDFLLLLSKSWSKSDRHRSYFLSLKPDIWLDWVAKLCS